MCHYCGCRDMPLIRDFIAEHDRAVDISALAVKAMDAGELDRARSLLQELATELDAHWKGEENGLFNVLLEQGGFEEHITPLVQDHRDLAKLLAEADLTQEKDREEIRVAVFELREHILKEEDGIFPASLTALGGEDWDASIAAWHDAHPGKELIADA